MVTFTPSCGCSNHAPGRSDFALLRKGRFRWLDKKRNECHGFYCCHEDEGGVAGTRNHVSTQTTIFPYPYLSDFFPPKTIQTLLIAL